MVLSVSENTQIPSNYAQLWHFAEDSAWRVQFTHACQT